MCAVLGPILVIGVLLVATAIVSLFISSWMPSNWFSGSVADWLVGGGVQGDAVTYIQFMVGGVLAGGSWYGITWGFNGTTTESDREP